VASPADPHGWLEEESAETDTWEREQDARAVAHLQEWAGLARLREQVGRADLDSRVFAPSRAGGRWFRLVVHEPYASPVLHVSDRPDDPGRVLLDPGHGWLDWAYPSPDGSLVAAGISERASEQSVLHLVDVASGRLLPERIPHTSFGVVAWLPDAIGFYYNRGLGPDTEQPQKHVFFHRVGDEPRAEPEPAVFRDDEEFIWPQVSDDGRRIAAVSSEAEPRPDSVLDREAGDGVWRPFLLGRPGVFNGFIHGDSYVAITSEGAPRGRLVRMPLDGGPWAELVPEGEAVMRSIQRAGDLLVLHELVETRSRLRLLTLDGAPAGEVPLPPDSAVGPLAQAVVEGAVSVDEGGLVFVLGTFAATPSLVRYDLASGRLETLVAGAPRPYAVDASYRRTAGGTTYWHLRRADADPAAPALVYGYGGWNIAFGLPAGLGVYEPFVAAGGTLVLPHLPGGGEHGVDQWEAGMRDRKQSSYHALYEVAEELEAARVGVEGASNGGLLASVAVTQRPALWDAVVALVPVTDLLRGPRDPYVAEFALEYGDPAVDGWLADYSPYQHVVDGEEYPPVLVVSGDTDVRCPAWHGRKLAARLQEAGAPALFRLRRDAGHQVAAHRDAHEWLGFLMRHLGLEPR